MKYSIYDYYFEVKKRIKDDIKSKPDSYIISVNQEEYIDYLLEEFGLQIIKIDNSRKTTMEKVRRTKPMLGKLDQEIQLEIVFARIDIPVIPNDQIAQIYKLLPSSFSLTHPKVSYTNGWISTEVPASDTEVKNVISEIKSDIEVRNKDIKQYQQEARLYAKELLQNRKSQFENEDALFQAISKKVSVPLKQKEDFSTVIPTILRYSEKIKAIAPPKAQPPMEYSLKRDEFNTILNLIDNCCLFFERTPQTFAKLKEEELRNVILSSLNIVFEGDAIGEAFSKLGKTDLFLKINKGGVFIAECKFWNGPVALKNTVQQILGYLTWRDSFGVIILFVKRRNFTNIINEIIPNVEKISSYSKGIEKLNDSQFKAFHHMPEDDMKLVEIHYLLYNLYIESKEFYTDTG